jgi:tetraacyldisaccharide 4'-kinase
MRAPGFWQHDGLLPRLLTPFSWGYAAATARRMARPGWRAPVPVICCGNATAGGSGKTTLALDLAARLSGRKVAFLTRGHGGQGRGRVDAPDPKRFGDEAVLLAQVAPTYVDPDRAAAARLAVADGAGLLIMDDGLQNPGLAKDLSILVIDGQAGFGNGRVIPAGPLREPVAAAAARCQAAVLIGADRTGALDQLPKGLPVLRARLVAAGAPAGARVLAFAGIGRPEKFAETLRGAGVEVAGLRSFPDHHRYSERDLDGLRAEARAMGAALVTTPKDAVKLPAGFAAVVGVALEWDDAAALLALMPGA